MIKGDKIIFTSGRWQGQVHTILEDKGDDFLTDKGLVHKAYNNSERHLVIGDYYWLLPCIYRKQEYIKYNYSAQKLMGVGGYGVTLEISPIKGEFLPDSFRPVMPGDRVRVEDPGKHTCLVHGSEHTIKAIVDSSLVDIGNQKAHINWLRLIPEDKLEEDAKISRLEHELNISKQLAKNLDSNCTRELSARDTKISRLEQDAKINKQMIDNLESNLKQRYAELRARDAEINSYKLKINDLQEQLAKLHFELDTKAFAPKRSISKLIFRPVGFVVDKGNRFRSYINSFDKGFILCVAGLSIIWAFAICHLVVDYEQYHFERESDAMTVRAPEDACVKLWLKSSKVKPRRVS